MNLFVAVIFLLIVFISSGTAEQNIPSDKSTLIEQKLFGKNNVKKRIKYISKNGTFGSESQILSIECFDKNGRIILDSNFADDSEFGTKYTKYEYDRNGDIKRIIYYGISDKAIVHTCIYDNNDKLVQRKIEYGDIEHIEYSYDSTGLLLQETHYSKANSEKIKQIEYLYNSAGLISKVLQIKFDKNKNGSGSLELEINNFYNSDTLVKSTAVYPEFDISNTVKFVYSDSGLLEKVIPIDSEGKEMKRFTIFFQYEFR